MTRNVNLTSYLPTFMKEYKGPVEALTAENPEFDTIWAAVDRVFNNRFIATADEYGISRFEKMLGISSAADEPLEIRRRRIQNRWFNITPYTVRTLRQKLAEMIGEHNFYIVMDADNCYRLILTIYFTSKIQLEEVEYLLSVMVPANIVTDIIYESAHKGTIYYGTVMSEADIIELKQR